MDRKTRYKTIIAAALVAALLPLLPAAAVADDDPVSDVKQYRLTLTAGAGGEVIGSESGLYAPGTVIALLAKPSAGFEFKNWTVDSDGKLEGYDTVIGTVLEFDMPAGDVKVRAKFRDLSAPLNMKVTLAANGGSFAGGTRSKSIKVTQGKKYGRLPTPKRTNHIFKGWWTRKSGGTRVAPSTTVKAAKRHTLYARWKEKDLYGVLSGAWVVNVRTRPSSRGGLATVAGHFVKGKPFRIYGEVSGRDSRADWYIVKYKNQKRYVWAAVVRTYRK